MVKIKKDITKNLEEASKKPVAETPEFSVGASGAEAVVFEKEPVREELARDQAQKLMARKEIEKADVDDSLKSQLGTHSGAIKNLDDQQKIKKLLQLAQKKGVVFAVKVAKNMDSPYILDTLHDALAKEGYYKSFLK
jgi:hypothetical protein